MAACQSQSRSLQLQACVTRAGGREEKGTRDRKARRCAAGVQKRKEKKGKTEKKRGRRTASAGCDFEIRILPGVSSARANLISLLASFVKRVWSVIFTVRVAFYEPVLPRSTLITRS